MSSREKLDSIIKEYSPEKWASFFRSKSPFFASSKQDLAHYQDEHFTKIVTIGTTKQDAYSLLISSIKVANNLSERTSRKAQYDKAKEILKSENVYDGGIFIFHDESGNFRFSLVYEQHLGVRRTFSNFRRFTYFVNKDFTNKTFLKQIGDRDFSTFNNIKEAFSLAAVTNEFYNSFFPVYEEIAESLASRYGEEIDADLKKNFALLFCIRIVFIGFIQKRKWLGDDEKFLQNYWKEYKEKFNGQNKFYERWIEPLFFEALANPPGHKVAYRNNEFSDETEKKLQMAPYLNGGLFLKKKGYDDKSIYIPDEIIEKFFDFLFSYNFTIEENSIEDEDLQLNPEFLGIIFERLVNKADGAVYTPRTEVDMMCRLSLVKWLEKNNTTNIPLRDLYELFFKEGGRNASSDEQRDGCFSTNQYKDILALLERITICDPAVGSGAFPVGMLHVLDEIEQKVRQKIANPDYELADFERKKRIISNSLYGVEVKEWAVWISQLRLWITLFIDAPDELKHSQEAILPSLDFKMRCGDSLVQRIGSKLFPVQGHADIKKHLKAKITQLKQLKADFFNNKVKTPLLVKKMELDLFSAIITEEIKAKREFIERHKSPNTLKEQMGFLQFDVADVKEKMPLFEDCVNAVQKEIEELEEERSCLLHEHPLVWNIEFAEVFADNGGFDIVIGNPPYVRQEGISDPTGKIASAKEYKGMLQEMCCSDFPDYFMNIKKKVVEKIDAKSDLYTYFYIRSLRLLNEKGLLTFICSNSWLDVGYGAWLQKFLLKKAPVHFILDNHAKRSFEAADVNTIISIIDAPQKKASEDHLIKFVAFKQPFEDVIFSENLIAIEETKEIFKTQEYRVYPISAGSLYEAGIEYEDDVEKTLDNGKYAGDKWGGKYLRAPDIFFTILEKGKDKLVRLGDIAEIRRGFTTGANEFFYLTDEQAKEWKIEKEYLKPVMKGPKDSPNIMLSKRGYKFWLFFCDKDKEQLKNTKALEYIKWGEKNGFHERPSTRGRRNWYFVGDHDLADIVFPVGIRECFKIFLNDGLFIDKRLYEIYYESNQSLVCVMNSSLFIFIIEMMARNYGGGGGPIDATVYEVENMIVLNPELFQIRLFNSQYNEFIKRDIKSIFLECGIDPSSSVPISEQEPKPLPDRAELDNIVFDALELTPDERKEVYRAVCQLVWNRISKARSV